MMLRRAAAAAMAGARRSRLGLPAGTPLLALSDALYGRRDEASAVDSDGTVDWYAENAGPRIVSSGLVVEPLSKNWLNRSVHLNASWTPSNGAVLTAGTTSAGSAPDGTTPAQIDFGALATSQIAQTIGDGTIPDNTILSLILWVTGVAGGEVCRFRLDNKDNVIGNTSDGTLIDVVAHATPGVWQQYRMPAIDIKGPGGTSGVTVRFLNAAAGGAKSVRAWGFFAFESKWDRSPIRTTSGPVTAQPEVVGFIDSVIPEHIRKRGTLIAGTPHWAPTGLQGLSSGDQKWLLGFQRPAFEFAGLYGYRVRHNGTDIRAEIVRNGSVMASSPAITGTTPRVRREFVFDPLGGRVAVDGVWGATGTPGAMPFGQVRHGGPWGDTQSKYEWDGSLELAVAS